MYSPYRRAVTLRVQTGKLRQSGFAIVQRLISEGVAVCLIRPRVPKLRPFFPYCLLSSNPRSAHRPTVKIQPPGTSSTCVEKFQSACSINHSFKDHPDQRLMQSLSGIVSVPAIPGQHYGENMHHALWTLTATGEITD